MYKTPLFPLLAAMALLVISVPARANETAPAFASYPTLSPDGKIIVFSFEGDLWKVPVTGGQALRLTAMRGEETAPRISPDGQWLAFTANQSGNADVYVMPMNGGEIRQLTYHDAADEVDSWSWDSKTIYFTSGRYNRFSSYKVPQVGGTATRLFPHFFNTIHNVVEKPNGELLFSDTWESQSAANRKRYKGAFNPDILSWHPATRAFKQYTDYIGKDFWPSSDSRGNLFFASDEENGEYNLYTFSKEKKKALTRFDRSIKRPFVAADGSKVVFEKDYRIHVYDVGTGKTVCPDIMVNRNSLLSKEQEFDIRDRISNADVSPDGKKMAFVSRGELFVSDIEGKFIRQMPSSGQRVSEVKWLPDNQTLLFNQTSEGYLNWFKMAANGKEEPIQLTDEKRSNRDIVFNHDKTKAVYLSGRDEVRLMDLKTLKSNTIAKDEIWAFSNSTPRFSPNGEYVLFTAYRNFEQDLFVHQIVNKKTIQLTKTGVSEVAPVWSPDGKYIFFASNRTKPSFPTGMSDARIYRMALDAFDDPFRTNKFDELFEKEEKEKKPADGSGKNEKTKEKKDSTAKKDSVEKKKTEKPIIINMDGLDKRIEQIGPSFGSQGNPFVTAKGDKTFLFYTSNHEGGRSALYRTVTELFGDTKTEKVSDNAGEIFEVEGKFYGLFRGGVYKYNLDMNRLEKIDLSKSFRRNLQEEFRQMFQETWAGIEENFYDGNFHGVNWKKVGETYAEYLPYLNNRSDLRVLLNDMLGELNSSHLGFSSGGPEESKDFSTVTNETGILFDAENPLLVSGIVEQSHAARKGVDIRKGDVLVAVDGAKVMAGTDRDFYFNRPSLAPEMSLTFLRNGKEIETLVRPERSGALKDQLYDEWISGNRRRVDSMGNKRIAYAYMKNMSGGSLEQFLLDMVEQENNTEATILDLRYNTGGNVHDEVLRFLSQRPYLQWQYRGGTRSPQSNFGPAAKPIVLLINEQSLSDAEMTAAGFKALKLGTIIGTETYRWIIFTSGKGLVDGSFFRIPAWGCYTLDGKDLELTGVTPDIHVQNTFVDRLEGRDPQLERAVDEIMEQLGKK